MLRLIERFLIAWTEAARRGGWFVVIAFLAATAFAGHFAAGNLKVNTDTSEMLDPDLPFQKNAAALREAFPQIKTDLLVIVRAPTLDEADAFAAAIRARLLAQKEVFSAVFAPAEEAFFLENGLLYLDMEELEPRLTQMTRASGLIETLVKSPTADTLFGTLAENDQLAERSELGKGVLLAIYEELANVVEAGLDGERLPFSWMGALDASDARKEQHIRVVSATPVLDFSRLQPAKPAIEAIAAEIEALAPKFGGRIETFVTGDPALRADELQSVTTGLGLSFAVSFLLVGALMVIAYRSLIIAGMTMVGLLITMVLTGAFAALAVGELNLISVAFVVLLFGLGQDFAIHLLLHIQERRGDGQTTKVALNGSMHEVGAALALSAVTTSLAFFSFIPTAFVGIAQLGLIAGVGVLISIIVSLTFLPAALGALPSARASKPSPALRRIFSVVETWSVPVAVMTTLLGIAALLVLPQARFDADPMSLRNPNTPSVAGFNLLFSDAETVPYRLTRLVDSAEEAAATAAAAKALPTVRATRSLPDFVPADQDEKLELISYAAGSLAFALDAAPDASPPTPGSFDADRSGLAALQSRLENAYTDGAGARLAALLKSLGEPGREAARARVNDNIFAYWPQLVERLRSQLNADYVTIETLPDALASRYRSADGKWRVDILPAEDLRDPEALDRFVDDVEAKFPDVSGGALQTKKAGEVISRAVIQATLIALAAISLFLLLLVGRPILVFFMVLPLALAAALTAATGALVGIDFNYANVIVLPLLLGIGIDSGIHLVMRRQQVTAGEGIYGTSTPRAILFAQLTTAASFGSLMLSPHRGTASMGALLTIAIAFTLICTLFVLPAAFRLAERQLAKPK